MLQQQLPDSFDKKLPAWRLTDRISEKSVTAEQAISLVIEGTAEKLSEFVSFYANKRKERNGVIFEPFSKVIDISSFFDDPSPSSDSFK